MRFIVSFCIILFAIVGCAHKDSLIKPHLLVIHGGPGLDHRYLVDGLSFLTPHRSVVFYDQVGVSQKDWQEAVLFDDYMEQLKQQINTIQKPYGIIAHSWGTILVYELIKRGWHEGLKEVIFITPAPLTRKEYDDRFATFFSKIPKKDIVQVLSIKDPLKQVIAALPYYLANSAHASRINIVSYNQKLAHCLMNQLKDYNYIDVLASLPQKTIWITGDVDFLGLPKEIGSEHIAVVPAAGHYVFYENPLVFQSKVLNFLKSLEP